MKHRSLLPGAVWLVISGAFLSFAQNNPVERYAAEGQAALAAGRYLDAEKAFEKLRELEPGVADSNGITERVNVLNKRSAM